LFSEGSGNGEIEFWGGYWGIVVEKGKDDVIFRGFGASGNVTDKLLNTACGFGSSDGGENNVIFFSGSLATAFLAQGKENGSLQEDGCTSDSGNWGYCSSGASGQDDMGSTSTSEQGTGSSDNIGTEDGFRRLEG
jgi:hypothetical protein